MNLHDIIGQFQSGQETQRVNIPDGWYQGRTCYGGLSTALAYSAARLTGIDMPPLQSAQIAFVGPLAGEVEVSAKMLRRGKNTAFVQTEIAGEGGIGHTATFIFMTQRESHFAFDRISERAFPPIPSVPKSGPPHFFTGQMEYAESRMPIGSGSNVIGGWQRLRDRQYLEDPFIELLAVGDALPPAAMGLMTENGMVSSMNWQVNMLRSAPTTKDGWWYLESDAHQAEHGASSQYMTAWNSEGQAVMTGMQSVAIFA